MLYKQVRVGETFTHNYTDYLKCSDRYGTETYAINIKEWEVVKLVDNAECQVYSQFKNVQVGETIRHKKELCTKLISHYTIVSINNGIYRMSVNVKINKKPDYFHIPDEIVVEIIRDDH